MSKDWLGPDRYRYHIDSNSYYKSYPKQNFRPGQEDCEEINGLKTGSVIKGTNKIGHGEKD